MLIPGGDLLSFSVPGETEKIAALWFARGEVSKEVDTTLSNELNFSVAVHIYKIHAFD